MIKNRTTIPINDIDLFHPQQKRLLSCAPMVAASDNDVEVRAEPGERGGRGSSDATSAVKAEHEHAPSPSRYGAKLRIQYDATVLSFVLFPLLVCFQFQRNHGMKIWKNFPCCMLHAGLGCTGVVKIFYGRIGWVVAPAGTPWLRLCTCAHGARCLVVSPARHLCCSTAWDRWRSVPFGASGQRELWGFV